MTPINGYMEDDEDVKIVGTPKVSSKLSKKLLHPVTGDEMFFIDKNEGMRLGLINKMNFNNTHPIATNMCEITINIERI